MKFLALALTLFGCLCGGYAQTTDNLITSTFQVTADTNVSSGVASQFNVGADATGSTLGSLTDLLGTSGGTGFDQLVTKIINDTGNTPGTPYTQFTAQDVMAGMDPTAKPLAGITVGPSVLMNDLLTMMGGPTATGPTSIGPTGTSPIGNAPIGSEPIRPTGTGPSPLDMFPPGSFPPPGPGGAGGFPPNMGLPVLPTPKPQTMDPMMMMILMNAIGGGEMMEQPEMMLPLMAMMSSQRKQQQPPPIPNPFATSGGGFLNNNMPMPPPTGSVNTMAGTNTAPTNPFSSVMGSMMNSLAAGGAGPSPTGTTPSSGPMDLFSMMSGMPGTSTGTTGTGTGTGTNNMYSDLMNSILAPTSPTNTGMAPSPMNTLFPGGMIGR